MYIHIFFVFQIVVDLDGLSDEIGKSYEAVREGKIKPKVLPPWDPMGALAGHVPTSARLASGL